MEKERKITAPEGCEIEKVEIVDGVAVVTFREKARKLPKSFAEFCEMFPDFTGEYFIQNEKSEVRKVKKMQPDEKRTENNAEILPDRATAEAVLALCQLIQLRNAYNGDWVPDWNDLTELKYVIEFTALSDDFITKKIKYQHTGLLYFKTEELCNEFLRNFRTLIEKLKPLYGIKKGGDE